MAAATILIVDDEADIRDVLALVLRDAGYRVLAAADGEAAIGLARENAVQLALVDLKMPGIDGHETLLRLKAIHPALPVVIATGCASTDVEMRSLDQGAFDCLWKPFDLQELLKLVSRALGSGQARLAH